MSCTAVGSFPKELPTACVIELASKLKSGASKSELCQITAQILGQVGALLDNRLITGATATPDSNDVEIAKELETLLTATQGPAEMMI